MLKAWKEQLCLWFASTIIQNVYSFELYQIMLKKEIKIIGKISSKGALQLDGVLEGEITASKLVIEKSAKVIGSVTSEDLVIKGRIIGPVFGKKVRFGSSARVEGDTFHETIAIEDGAYYEGSIRRHAGDADTQK